MAEHSTCRSWGPTRPQISMKSIYISLLCLTTLYSPSATYGWI